MVCLIDTNQAELDLCPVSATGMSMRAFFAVIHDMTASGVRSGGEADRSFDHVLEVLQRLANCQKPHVVQLATRQGRPPGLPANGGNVPKPD
jgi:hypothetical protein